MRTRMSVTHDHFGGKLHLYQRERTPYWQCSTYLAGRNHRTSTKELDLNHARKKAEEWYLSLQLKHRTGELRSGHLFKQAVDHFLPEYEALTKGERNPVYVENVGQRLRKHLVPFFGNRPVTDITPQTVQDYRVHRMTKPKSETEREEREAAAAALAKEQGKTFKPVRLWKPPARTTLKSEIVVLRHVLKTAERLGWLKFIPDLSPPYRSSSKISHRAWFTNEEYKQLYEATRERAANPPHGRWKWECEQLHDFVLFMGNTGLRPDEAARLQFRDVEVVEDKPTAERILEITVRGKRGTGYCKSMPGAVLPFERLRSRKRWNKVIPRMPKGGETTKFDRELVLPKSIDLIFPSIRHHHLNTVLEEQGLKFDREGLRRSAYSLRHTYICLRLLEGADIYQVSKNCRTSIEMIEKYYASHLKNMIDAAAVNVRSSRSKGRPKQRTANAKRPSPGTARGHPRPRR